MRPDRSTTSGLQQSEPRVVGLVGTSGSGKTTLALKLIARWTADGYRVATIKHAHAGFEIDHPGKDSMRHREAGAKEVLISSNVRMAHIRENDPEANLDELLDKVEAADIILVEGFKAGAQPKLEIYREANGKAPLIDAFPNIFAQASPGGDPDLNDISAISELLLDRSIPRSAVRLEKIYLDHNATTPLSPDALRAMTKIYAYRWGNPGSVEHSNGRAAAEELLAARTRIASCIGAQPEELIFTSGATEANNLAIQGCALFRTEHESKTRIIVTAVEHKCVLEAAKHSGLEVNICSVRPNGDIDFDHLESLLGNDVAIISVMLVNNETGVIQDMPRIARLAHLHDAKLHTDAAQALGKIELDVEALGVDFLSLSAHKAYGPMGVGALYVRRRPRARLAPLFVGGGQERGLRSGTVPLPLAVGFSVAAQEATALVESEHRRLSALQSWFEGQINARFPTAIIKNGAKARVANTMNISFPDLEYTTLFAHVSERFSISSGSACSSADIEPSYVLKAMGFDDNTARSTLRIGMGRSTTRASLQALIHQLEALA